MIAIDFTVSTDNISSTQYLKRNYKNYNTALFQEMLSSTELNIMGSVTLMVGSILGALEELCPEKLQTKVGWGRMNEQIDHDIKRMMRVRNNVHKDINKEKYYQKKINDFKYKPKIMYCISTRYLRKYYCYYYDQYWYFFILCFNALPLYPIYTTSQF